jgi:CBS domain-containing protein
MKMDVVICRDHDPVSECARLMLEYDVGLLPVLDVGDRVVGVVTDRDLVTRIMADPLRDGSTPVHRVMSLALVTCSAEDALEEVGQTILESKKLRIVVVDEARHCVGIISASDIG